MFYWKKATCIGFTIAFLGGQTLAQTVAQVLPSSKTKSVSSFAALPPIDPEEVQRVSDSLKFCSQGDASAQHLAWKQAQQEYQQARDLWPDNLNALYGLAECSLAGRDMAKAVDYYRKAIYSSNPADKGFREGKTEKLMRFVVLLSKTGQGTEALSVYNHAASALNYQDSQFHAGKPNLEVLLPTVVVERTLPYQVRYTPERLQALADVAIAYQQEGFMSEKQITAYQQEALELYPDSPVVYYYLGEHLLSTNDPGAKAACQKAMQLGDAPTVAAAKERIEQCR